MSAGKVFLSYSQDDRAMARPLATALNTRDIDAWSSEGSIEPGEVMATALRRMINDSDAVVVLVSRNSINSPGLLLEAGAAIGQDKRVVVVTLSASADRELPLGREGVASIAAESKKPDAIADRIAALLLRADEDLPKRRRRSLNQLHVMPRDGGWAVEKTGAKRASSVHENKADALKAARDAARRSRSDLIVHNKDGRVMQKDSFGSDPRRSKS